jgi:myo-inositol-1(or 4)-monophosphatase
MNQEINIETILDVVKQAGDFFLSAYKSNIMPKDKEDFFLQLKEIDERCMSILCTGLNGEFPDIPWNTVDEFDNDGQKQALPLPEYWVCDAMDGAIQFLQHIPGWTVNLALIRNGEVYFSVIYDPLANEMFWAQRGSGLIYEWKTYTPRCQERF